MEDQIIPKHIGYIVDGNRRWAKENGLPSYEGHLAGYKTLKDIAIATLESGVEYMSAYVWSTENWKRSDDETSRLMKLLVRVLTSDLPIFMENNIRLRVLGSSERLSQKVLDAIKKAEDATKNNTGGTFAMCFNYGGQQELTDAVKKIVQSGVASDEITPELIEQNIYEADIPPVDIVVRTGGEQRLSNFMMWRSAYSELLFIDKFWPDMSKEDVNMIIEEFSSRSRRFGG